MPFRVLVVEDDRSAGNFSARAQGAPRLLLTLERMGGLPPQSWEMGFDGTGDFHLAAQLEDRPARKVGKRRQAA